MSEATIGDQVKRSKKMNLKNDALEITSRLLHADIPFDVNVHEEEDSRKALKSPWYYYITTSGAILEFNQNGFLVKAEKTKLNLLSR